MRDTAAKGRIIEDRFIGILKGMGYRCERARAVRIGPSHFRRVQVYDFFESLDVLAVHRTLPPLAAQVTTDSQTVRSKVAKMESIIPYLHSFGEVLVARWIAPEKPGERGAFGVYRREEMFEKRHLLASDAASFPWCASPPPPNAAPVQDVLP